MQVVVLFSECVVIAAGFDSLLLPSHYLQSTSDFYSEPGMDLNPHDGHAQSENSTKLRVPR